MAWGVRRNAARVAILATVLGLVAVIGFDGSAAVAARTGDRTAAAPSKRYYVSLGDSYAVGFQPGLGATRHGFPDQVVTKATRRGYHLQLVNFGCGGATTTSILQAPTCPLAARPIHGAAYAGLTQAAAAEPYGLIPVAVARVCTLTYYCKVGDIHATTAGYGVIADLIVATLPRV